MIRPDLSADTLLRRHQNPAGIVLRAIAVLMLIAGLWTRSVGLIALAVLIETGNWTILPGRDNPPEWVEQVLDMEFAWLDLPPGALKSGLGAGFGIGLAFVGLGVFAHHFGTILLGLVLVLAVLGLLRHLATR